MRSLAHPLRVQAFRRLVAAYGINTLGTWLGEIALTVLVLRETGSPAAVAAVWIVGQFAPSLVVPALVARLDRFPVRRVVPTLLAAEAVIFAVLAATAHSFSLPLVLSLAALDAVLGLAARALLRASAVAASEPRGLLREANAILATVFTICASTGPILAGVAIASASIEAALIADAVSFALAALVLGTRVDLPACRPRAARAETGRLRAALAHVWSQAALRRLLVGFGAVSLFGAAVIPVEILLVTDTLGGSEAAYGAVLAAWGIGSVAGSGLVTVLRRASLARLVVGSFLVMAVSYVGMGTAASIEVVILFSALGGMGNGIEGFATMTAIQEATSDGFQARVSGLVEAVAAAATGAGFFLGGAIATVGSTRAAYLVGGAGIIVAAGLLAARPRARLATLKPA